MIPVTIRLFLLVLLSALLAGCSIAELERVATDGERNAANAPIDNEIRPTSRTFEKPADSGFVAVESILLGGQQDVQGVGGVFRRYAAGENVQEILFRRPVAVGGVDNLLYILDADFKLVFQYDLSTGLFSPHVIEIGRHITGDPSGLFVARDRSFYIVDGPGKQVLHFSEQGEFLNRFQDLANLSRPVDVLVDEMTGNVFVADGSFGHIIVFNSFGKAIRVISRRGMSPGRSLAITALAAGPDGLYVFDRLSLPVQVFSWNGEFRYSFGEDELSYPIAGAVDRQGRVYVSEQADNSLRIYQDGVLVETFGGAGAEPGRFRTATDLWIRNGRLYVADSLNRRIQVLKIEPGAAVSTGELQ